LRRKYLFTSESVTEGHPDKVADQISDGVLDELIRQDTNSRVAVETVVTTGMAFVTGEVTTRGYVDIPKVVRGVIKDIGYDNADYGFDYKTCAVISAIDEQSPDIDRGVTPGGAGDQGMMFGFASNETQEFMPLPILLAHKLTSRLSSLRREGILPWLRPDGKSQVSVEYVNGKPEKVKVVVISTQHSPDIPIEELRKEIINKVVEPIIDPSIRDKDIVYHINPTGRFVVGGPQGDSGLTGRKIIVDTYGGFGAHGGGAFSGKDPTKVDRSASYMARYIAKNIVASGVLPNCEVQLAYAIGVADPVSVMLQSIDNDTNKLEKLEKITRDIFPLRPKDIISYLDLRRPIYRKTAAFGHFGRELDEFTWERTDLKEKIKKEFSKA